MFISAFTGQLAHLNGNVPQLCYSEKGKTSALLLTLLLPRNAFPPQIDKVSMKREVNAISAF